MRSNPTTSPRSVGTARSCPRSPIRVSPTSSDTLASLVHEARQASVGPEGVVVLRPDASGALVERIGDGEFRLVGRDVERVVALNDVTTPEALSYIDLPPRAARRAEDARQGRCPGGRRHLDRRVQLRLPAGSLTMRVVAKIGTASITDDRWSDRRRGDHEAVR